MRKILITTFLIFISLLLMGASCFRFSLEPEKGFQTSGPAGMFVSTDKGDSWKQISALPTVAGVENIAGVSIYKIAEDPQDPQALYLASRSQGMFFSYDDGKTWQKAKGPPGSGFIYSIAVHPKDKCTIYATNGAIVYKSEDCNRSWKEAYRESRANVRVESIAFNPFNPKEIFMVTSNGDLLKSSDNGLSWNKIYGFTTRLAAVEASHLQDGLLYVISRENGLYRSEDGGRSWVSLANKLKKFSGSLEYRRHLLHPANANVFYWISTYGVLATNDKGENWEALNLITPPGSVNIYGFAVDPQNDKEVYYTATIESRSTFYRSVDGGKNWVTKKLPSGQIPTALRVHPENEEWVYLGFTIPPKQ